MAQRRNDATLIFLRTAIAFARVGAVRCIDAHRTPRGCVIDLAIAAMRAWPACSDRPCCNCLRDIPRVYEMALWAHSSSAHAGCAGERQYARMT
jgi:hypothetical protein